MKTNTKIGVAIGVASVVSAAAGAASGYFFAKTRLEQIYSDRAQTEIIEAKAFYFAMSKKQYKTPAEAVEALIPVKEAAEAILAYQGQEVVVDLPSEDSRLVLPGDREIFVSSSEDHNVFEDADPNDDAEWEREVASRSNDLPYIISEDEFMHAEAGYNQTTLTYYEGDETLADERDQPIGEVEETIGIRNIRFGYRCGDKNVVHIRNNKLALEFEVVRSEGKYAEEVLGQTKGGPG